MEKKAGAVDLGETWTDVDPDEEISDSLLGEEEDSSDEYAEDEEESDEDDWTDDVWKLVNVPAPSDQIPEVNLTSSSVMISFSWSNVTNAI